MVLQSLLVSLIIIWAAWSNPQVRASLEPYFVARRSYLANNEIRFTNDV